MLSNYKIIKEETIESVKRRFRIIGNAPILNHTIHTALRVAPTNMNVLITGENGSGKESFSHIIHYFSTYKHGKLIAVNCGGIPEGTIDSELFGHEKGSFTGAYEARKGYFQEADKGTIFLDEIGEMPLSTQARLLRILEYGEFMRVGSSKTEKTEVRIIAATHVDLKRAVEKGTFREDLYYRLNAVSLHIPPLRERGKDILLLFKKFTIDFMEEYGGSPLGLTAEATQILEKYPFPGNVRELKNLVVRMSVLEQDNPLITEKKIKSYLPDKKKQLPSPLSDVLATDEKLSEREILYKVLFHMREDLTELKKIVYQKLNQENKNPHVHQENSLFFDSFIQDHSSKRDPIALLPKNKKTLSPPIIISKEAKGKDLHLDEEDPVIPLDKLKKKAIIHALKRCKNNRKEAAKALGMSERTLYRDIDRYQLEGKHQR